MIVLKREFYKYLLKWKNKRDRKPILLLGARQVGKTFLLKYFAENEFDNYIYVNFEKENELVESLKSILNPDKILEFLSIYYNKTIKPENTLIIFDEVQNSPQTIASLKYFYEEKSKYYVIATGSLLGVTLYENINTSFPVGKVDIQYLYPLSFMEFLASLNETKMLEFLYSKKDLSPIPEIFHKKLIEKLKLYYFTGGMPEPIVIYLETKNFQNIRKVQKDILQAYIIDSTRYADKTTSIKIRDIWNSIPKQISKENRKFKLAEIRKNASMRDYKKSLDWLINAGLVYKIVKVKRPEIPLSAYSEDNIFKIFLLDTGLLSSMLDLSEKVLLKSSELFLLYKGAFTENYIAQELKLKFQKELYYWANNTSEIDFLFSYNDKVIPIEIKSGFNTKAKSFKVYIEKYKPRIAIRSSLNNFNRTKNICDIPLYALSLFPQLIKNV